MERLTGKGTLPDGPFPISANGGELAGLDRASHAVALNPAPVSRDPIHPALPPSAIPTLPPGQCGTPRYRPRLPFRAVNRLGEPQFDPGLQRHHLLPRQLLGQGGFSALFEAIDRERVGFDDFRRNGMLLPANDAAALRLRMPMHRGPHRAYNALVAERVGQVEGEWARLRLRAPEVALTQALMRLDLLQRALRRRLLAPNRPFLQLNRHDPLGAGLDFACLDALADALWGVTEPVHSG